MRQLNLLFTVLLVPIDFLAFILAGISAYALRTSGFITGIRPVLFYINLPFAKYLWLVAIFALFLIIIFAFNGLYKIKKEGRAFEELSKIFAAVSAGFVCLIIYIFFKREWFDSRFIILAAWFFVITYAIVARLIINLIQKFLVAHYRIGRNKVLFIGDDKIVNNIIKEINSRPDLGYDMAGHLAAIDLDLLKKSFAGGNIDEVILADLDSPREKILELVDWCADQHIIFKFAPNLWQTLTINAEVDTLAGIPLIELRQTSLTGWGRVFKRIVDIFGSLVGLIILSPLFVIIAIIIKLDSDGSVFAKLKRISYGKAFSLYKFRSMVKNAEALKGDLLKYNERRGGPLFKMKNDPRITRFGRFLRRTRLDEFPQLFNVLNGEMSLIGPRPHQPDEIAQYSKEHRKLLAIKAGISGMAQTSGSSDLPFEEEVKLDTYYIENWSILMDLKILLKTFFILFTDKSAC